MATKSMLKLVSLCTFFWLIRPIALRTCPQCKHLLGRHQRRADGSFRD